MTFALQSQGMTSYGGVRTGITAQAASTVPTDEAHRLGYINVITVSAADTDGQILPAGVPQGGMIWIFNQDSAQDIKVWPNTGATIQGGTATTQYVVLGQTQALLCVQVGTNGLTWMALLGAVCTPT